MLRVVPTASSMLNDEGDHSGVQPSGRRPVDLSAKIGLGWQLVRVDQVSGEPIWYLEKDGKRTGTITRQFTSRLRPGWKASLSNGFIVIAPSGLATAAGSTLWRARDLAAAGIAEHLGTR